MKVTRLKSGTRQNIISSLHNCRGSGRARTCRKETLDEAMIMSQDAIRINFTKRQAKTVIVHH
ncbi:hypothetical protein V1478_010297 [Vespula squamosa]|uniref:Uncharacterized protein n=1 Tax=Vespula squamosa TaxID=30214 RepID=A0ABD2AHD3_VESSQ